MYDIKNIYRAKTIDEAIKLLDEHEDGVIISGGSDVLISLRDGGLQEANLISINEVDELSYVKMDDEGTIHIGSKTCFTDVHGSEIIEKYVPMLGYAADQVGGPQIRNIGTIGGNVCNGMTSADTASSLVALDAIMVVKSVNGTREIPIKDWYVTAGKTVREHNELLIEIKITKDNYENYYGRYIKYAMRKAMDIATIGTVAYVKLSEDKKNIVDLRLSFGVAGPTPMRARNVEERFNNCEVSLENVVKISEDVLKDVNPRDSWRASKIFRQQIIKENIKRCLISAITEAGGELDA